VLFAGGTGQESQQSDEMPLHFAKMTIQATSNLNFSNVLAINDI